MSAKFNVLLIDNKDSFVYNLARYVGELGHARWVRRSDHVSLMDIEALNPTHIIISPGPCTPDEAGISLEAIDHFKGKIPILGICLGHQAIGQAFGAKVVRAQYPMHGKKSFLEHTQKGVFHQIPSPFWVARYHSLIVSEHDFPEALHIDAMSPEQEIMAISHRQYPIWGLQFHPESILTQNGHTLLDNFLKGA